MAKILEVLIKASERAACIARSCTGSVQETLLVAEKTAGDANARFARDFKTIADVLAQESAKAQIASRFPELAKDVRGEECAEINGVLIKICESQSETKELLSSLVPSESAQQMAEAAHKDITLAFDLPHKLPALEPKDIGIWIDPIDATAEFIAGVQGDTGAECGLACVTVLIGAYLKSTGEPVIGVINQPFFDNGNGRIIWGVNCNDIKLHGGANCQEDGSKIMLISAAETDDIRAKMIEAGWTPKSLPGAGNKLMKVALGEADGYIVSKGTTFRWDTCAPHAILKARGGDIVTFNGLTPLTYNDPDNTDKQQYCNKNGIIAFKNYSVLEKAREIF